MNNYSFPDMSPREDVSLIESNALYSGLETDEAGDQIQSEHKHPSERIVSLGKKVQDYQLMKGLLEDLMTQNSNLDSLWSGELNKSEYWQLIGSSLASQSDGTLGEVTIGRDSQEFDNSHRYLNTLKRVFDLAGALILAIICLPLFLTVGLMVKLDSPGPVFFRHRRVGRDGRHFTLWKFRSMIEDAAEYAPSPANSIDIRLTRVGRFIRRFSLDEIPQLINVFRGEMSLVGPRPEMPFIVERYGALERYRLKVKPGITGLWQISPARSFPIHENLQYDFYYIRNWNLFLDIWILLQTVSAVVRGIGAV